MRFEPPTIVRRTFAGASQLTCTCPSNEPAYRTDKYAMFSVGLPPWDAPCAAAARGQGLKNQDVLPRRDRRLGDLEMRKRWRGDHDEVEIGRLDDFLDPVGDRGNPKLRPHPRRALVLQVADGLYLTVRM